MEGPSSYGTRRTFVHSTWHTNYQRRVTMLVPHILDLEGHLEALSVMVEQTVLAKHYVLILWSLGL